MNRVSLSMRARMSRELVAHLPAPVDTEAKGEAAPLARVDSHRLEHGGVQHATPPELNPSGELAGATTLAATDGAGDLELGRGLGEGEDSPGEVER